MARSVCLLLVVCVIAAALADQAPVLSCDEETKCAVSNVVVDPCPLKRGYCLFHIGENATISFDITPEFSATKLKNEVSYQNTPFPSLDQDACLHTVCPVTPGANTTVSYTLLIRKTGTAVGQFLVKWKVWNEDNTADLCCFKTKLKIAKARKVRPA